MKGSWKIGQVLGVAIRIHVTFPLLLIWIGVMRYLERGQWGDAVAGIGFMVALFVFVTLHELGHAVVARRFGIRTRDITLLPIGGVARLEKMPTRPLQELLIAFAGPAVNLALALLLFGLLAVGGVPTELASLLENGILARLAWVNVTLALFNLLPAFPMDGGRVLRAVLAMRFEFAEATKIAARFGQGVAVLLGLVGLISNPVLVLIAVVVWIGAAEELRATQLRRTLAGTPVEEVMMTEFHVLMSADPLQRAVDFARASRQQHFPVMEGEAMVGVLGWEDLLTGLSTSGPQARVGDYMRHRVGAVHSTDKVDRVLDRARDDAIRAVPVVDNGKIVGLFTTENLVESAMLQDAIERGPHEPSF